jgi:uncharacterized OB-fold protein
MPGVIAAIQTFGTKINFHPHLHFLVTEGGVAMKCPKCQFDNTPDSAFCRKCGSHLPLSAEVQLSKTMILDSV